MLNGKPQPQQQQQEEEEEARMEKAAEEVVVAPRGRDRAAAALVHVEEGARKKKQPVGQLRSWLRLAVAVPLSAPPRCGRGANASEAAAPPSSKAGKGSAGS